jgi:hypothetical protein
MKITCSEILLSLNDVEHVGGITGCAVGARRKKLRKLPSNASMNLSLRAAFAGKSFLLDPLKKTSIYEKINYYSIVGSGLLKRKKDNPPYRVKRFGKV